MFIISNRLIPFTPGADHTLEVDFGDDEVIMAVKVRMSNNFEPAR